jgi:hypothetical protein
MKIHHFACSKRLYGWLTSRYRILVSFVNRSSRSLQLFQFFYPAAAPDIRHVSIIGNVTAAEEIVKN